MMKIGIAGNGKIIANASDGFQKAGMPMTALWCRNEAHGRPVADRIGIQNVYTDYDAFLADPSFDTVYIGLANSAHYTYAKRALQAHKHVIVEKPMTSTYREAADLVKTAQEADVFLFEAILSRYSKNYDALPAYLDQIGDLKLIRANYSQYSSRYDRYRKQELSPAFDPACSGGCLYDLNVYNVHFTVGLFGAPKSAYYMANKGFNGIDTSGVLLMDYGQFKAVLTAAKDSASASGTILQGEDGTMIIHDRPGYVDHVTVHDRIKGTDTELKLNDEPEADCFRNEFLAMQDVIEQHDHAQEQIWLNRSLTVMMILENARQDAGIVFPADAEGTEQEEALDPQAAELLKHFGR
jgi:predicted dehydrogenase